ncbi:hypothetical protein R3P38DRAFT_3492060 [Favolaschia claudopus]|uniref:Uncharacterized protein n=1 Tax=Favolaschia claudopus TaxID=2862362 RepID=A0AAW0EAP7_9AGAR
MRHDGPAALLLMFADELAARLPPDAPISIMNVSPGFCHSRLTRETESELTEKILVGTFKRGSQSDFLDAPDGFQVGVSGKFALGRDETIRALSEVEARVKRL